MKLALYKVARLCMCSQHRGGRNRGKKEEPKKEEPEEPGSPNTCVGTKCAALGWSSTYVVN